MTCVQTIQNRAAVFVIGMAVLTAAPGKAEAAPQTFNTALPVAKDQFVFREQFLYRKASDDPAPTDRELDVLGAVSVLGSPASTSSGYVRKGPPTSPVLRTTVRMPVPLDAFLSRMTPAMSRACGAC